MLMLLPQFYQNLLQNHLFEMIKDKKHQKNKTNKSTASITAKTCGK
jgi:hypothetical protein